MRYLIYSSEIDGAGFPKRLLQEGHEVDFFIKNPVNDTQLDGYVNKVYSLEEGLKNNPDVIVFDMVKNGEIADGLRKKGHKVIGGSKFQDVIELQRFYGMQLCERLGLFVPPYKVFDKKDVQGAINFVAETQQRYVLKPNGNLALDMTYVSKDPYDMIQMLEWLEKAGKMKEDFLLQEFIKGVELSTEVWFAKGKPIYPANGTIEQKKFMSGDKGPNTGSESSVVWRYEDPNSKIVEQTLAKLYPVLEEMEYTGPLDVNSIVANEKAYFLEFTARFGYSAIYGLLDILNQDFGQLLYDVACGEVADMDVSDEVSFVLTVSAPPYPLNRDDAETVYEEMCGKKVLNVPENNFWPHDMYYDPEEECHYINGADGLVCFISAPAPTIEEAEELVYGLADDIDFSDKQYRIDGTERFKKDVPDLDEAGFEIPAGACCEEVAP